MPRDYSMERYDDDCARAGEKLRKAQEQGASWVMSSDFFYALHKAGVLPGWPWLTRVVIDAQVGNTVRMFVEHIPGATLLDVAIEASGIQVTQLTAPVVLDNASSGRTDSHDADELADDGTVAPAG
jgi:hypothetical protein